MPPVFAGLPAAPVEPPAPAALAPPAAALDPELPAAAPVPEPPAPLVPALVPEPAAFEPAEGVGPEGEASELQALAAISASAQISPESTLVATRAT
jgi:hypothetical protein